MLNVFIDMFDELSVILGDIHLNEYLLLDRHLLKHICSFLKVFDEAIEELSEDKKPNNL